MEETQKEKATNFMRGALPLIYLIVALLALRWTVVEPYVVPTGSMEPTLKCGDRLYALKCAYDIRFPFTDWILFRTGKVKRGDVFLFRAPPNPSQTYVKRCIGIPGDRIRFSDGKLFVNDQEVMKTPVASTDPIRNVMYDIEDQQDKTLYVEKLGNVKHYAVLDNLHNSLRNMEEVVVPPGYYFASGDNRDHSYDSRAWGFVPEENLKGRAMFIWFSSLDFTPRPERVGTLIQ